MNVGRMRSPSSAADSFDAPAHAALLWRAARGTHQERERVLGACHKDALDALDERRVRDIDSGFCDAGPLHVMSAIRLLRVDAVQQALEAGAVVPEKVVEHIAYVEPNAGPQYGNCMFEREYIRRARPVGACLRAAPKGVDAAQAICRKQQILMYLSLAGVRPTVWEQCVMRLTPRIRWPNFARRAASAKDD